MSADRSPVKPNENLPGLGRIVRLVRMVRLIPALKSMVYLILALLWLRRKTFRQTPWEGEGKAVPFSEGGGLEHATRSFRVI